MTHPKLDPRLMRQPQALTVGVGVEERRTDFTVVRISASVAVGRADQRQLIVEDSAFSHFRESS
jgi:hypothetical protein